MICFTKKKKDDSDNPDNQIEKIRLSNPKSSCLKAIRIFTIEQRQISCLDYDLKEHEWFLIKSDMSLQNTKKDDLQLTETIQAKRQQFKEFREDINEKLSQLDGQKKEIKDLEAMKKRLTKELENMKVLIMRNLCKNIAIKKQLVLEKMRFEKQIDFALNYLQYNTN